MELTNLHSLKFPKPLQERQVISHVNLISKVQNQVIPDQTVVVNNGKIVQIGSSSENMQIEGHFIDGTGLFLMPGLADMHVHYWSPVDAPLYLANGITHVRNMSGTPYHLALQQQYKKCILPGPYLMTTSPIIEHMNLVPPSWQQLLDPEQAAHVVKEQVKRGYQQIKVYNHVKPEVLRALGKAAREENIRVVGHCPNDLSFEEAMDAGMYGFEHFVGIWRGHLASGVVLPSGSNISYDVLKTTAEYTNLDDIRRLAHQMAQKQIWNCPTLVAMQQMYQSQEMGLSQAQLVPILKYVPAAAIDTWQELDMAKNFADGLPSFEQWYAQHEARNDLFLKILSILREEGAPVLIGTDAPVRFVVQGFSLHQELANLIEAGFSQFEALKCATSEAARFMGELDQWGTVETGKRANLLLLRANPLESIDALKQIEAVFINSFYLDQRAIQKLLLEVEHIASHHIGSDQLSEIKSFKGTEARHRMLETRSGKATGYLTYQHSRLTEKGWLLEEMRTFEQGSIFEPGGIQRMEVRLELQDDFTISHGRIEYQTFAGSSVIEVSKVNKNRFSIKRRDPDGAEFSDLISAKTLLMDFEVVPSLLSLFIPALNLSNALHQVLRVDPYRHKIIDLEQIPDAPLVNLMDGFQKTPCTCDINDHGHLTKISVGNREFTPM